MAVTITNATLSFLRQLAKNNHREWFIEHKDEYQQARQNVVDFTEALIEKTAEFDEEIIKTDANKALFRIYRDTRFSLDKTPYKTNFGIGLGFKRANGSAGYYLHIEPGKSFTAGGIYQPENAVLKDIRKEISLNGERFRRIIEQDEFRNNFRGLSVEHKLKRIPAGFEKDDPMAEYLKLKSFNVNHPVSDDILMQENATAEIARIFGSIKPLNDFLNTALK